MSLYNFEISKISRVIDQGFVIGLVTIAVENETPANTMNGASIEVRVALKANEPIEALEVRILRAAGELCSMAGSLFAAENPDDLRRRVSQRQPAH